MFMNKVRSQAKPVRHAFLAVAISAVAVLSSVGVAVPANAQDALQDPSRCWWYQYEGTSDSTVTLNGYQYLCFGSEFAIEYPRHLEIPSNVNGFTVTAIGENAFNGVGLESVTIPSSVTSIGESAFAHNSLTTMTIPNSVTSIDYGAFAQNELTSVSLGKSVTSIGEQAFAFNSLTTLTIPNSVTSIGDDAFSTNKLTSLKLGKSVATIGNNAFAMNGLKAVSLPASLTSLGSWAFGGNAVSSVSFAGDAVVDNSAFDGSGGPNNAKLCFIHVETGSTGWDSSFSGVPVKVGGSAVCKPAGAPSIRSIVGLTGTALARMRIWLPKNDGGSDIQYFEFTTDNGQTWQPDLGQEMDGKIIIAGLTEGTRYAVRLRAVTLFGPGAASKVVKFAPQGIASAPVIESITPDSGKVLVKVAAPEAGGSKITRYGYSIDGRPIIGAGSASASGSFWIKGLKPGVSVSISVFAATKAGWSLRSAPAQAKARK
jgi:BspA type Leucine rich repeat region (6 copies)